MDIKKYYERQISLSEWFEKLNYKSSTEFRLEDNEKRERLRFLKSVIGVPFDEPLQFDALELTHNTKRFIVNKNCIIGEIIRGMHNQLSQGLFDANKPILFSYDFKKLKLDTPNKDAE